MLEPDRLRVIVGRVRPRSYQPPTRAPT